MKHIALLILLFAPLAHGDEDKVIKSRGANKVIKLCTNNAGTQNCQLEVDNTSKANLQSNGTELGLSSTGGIEINLDRDNNNAGTEALFIKNNGLTDIFRVFENGQTSISANGQPISAAGAALNAVWSAGAKGIYFANNDSGGGDTVQIHFQVADANVNDSNHVMLSMDYVGDTDATGGVFIRFEDGAGVIGSVSVASTSSVAYNTTSDGRLKTVTNPYTLGLEKVMQLKPVEYYWNEDENKSKEVGFIAQDVYQVDKRFVIGDPDTPIGDDKESAMQMDYGRITPLLVSAIQEQQKIIEDLKKRLDTLEGK